ncbi:MAG: lysozyme [Actinomycetota bacterium]|nr:lysozyme [Actinomycetota bacterium]
MSTLALETHLALWRRRYRYRDGKLRAAKHHNHHAEIHKWGVLLAETVPHIIYLRGELAKRKPHAQVVSVNGVNFIKAFEGFSSAPYDDGTGVWTIGYGHIEGVTPSSPHITEPQASALLQRDLDRSYCPAVNALHVKLTQNQFDALTSFVYNLGVGSMQWDVGRDVRAGQFRWAADAMLQYDHAGGRVFAGLTRRRHAERALFLS